MNNYVFLNISEHPRFKEIRPGYVCLNCANFERCLELFNNKHVTLCSLALERQKLKKFNQGEIKNGYAGEKETRPL